MTTPARSSSRHARAIAARACAALAAACAGTAQADGHLVTVGSDWLQTYQIDLGSIVREGDFARYRLVGQGNRSKDSYDGRIEVDCVNHKRRELGASIDTSYGALRNRGTPEMYDVFPNTRPAKELELACAGAIAAPQVQALTQMQAQMQAQAQAPVRRLEVVPTLAPPPPPPSPAAMPPARAIAAGVLLDASGLVAAPRRLVDSCSRIEGTLDGRGVKATLVVDDAQAGIALLRLAGGPFPMLSLRIADTAGDEPVTLLGLGARVGDGMALHASAGALRRAQAGGAGADQVATAEDGVATNGPVFDAHGTLVGLAVDGSTLADRQRLVAMVPAAALRDLQRVAGLAWYGDTGTQPIAPAAALRQAMRATVALACYTSP